MIVDSHAHLDRYDDDAVDAMLARARGAGLAGVLAVGSDVASSRRALDLAGRHPGFALPAAGLHPLRMPAGERERGEALAAIAHLAERGAVAIGEVGLDYTEATAPERDAQCQAFAALARLAARRGLPLNVHQRVALDDTLRILRDEAPGVTAALHYFAGTAEDATRALAQGLFISFGKPLTRAEGAGLRAIAATMDRARALVETDTYPLPGRTTEPRDAIDVARALAAAWGAPFEDAARQLERNFEAYLGPRAIARDGGAARLRPAP